MDMYTPDLAIFQFGTALMIILGKLLVLGIIMGIPAIVLFLVVLFGLEFLLRPLAEHGPKFLRLVQLMFRSLQRNLLRTSLTFLAIFVLVLMVTGILSILNFIDALTVEKAGNQKAIITEKFQNPSGMPQRMSDDIWNIATKDLPEQHQPKSYRIAKFIRENNIQQPEALLTQLPSDLRPKDIEEAREMMNIEAQDDIMTWSFVAGTTDPDKTTYESMMFLFVLEPRKLKTMMPGLEELTPAEIKMLDNVIIAMKENLQGIVVGEQRLKMMRKQVGDKIIVYSKNYKDVKFEYEIIGVLPKGRWDQAAAMNMEYLKRKMKQYETDHGKTHEFMPKIIALIWLRLPNKEAFQYMADLVNNTKNLNVPVKMETESSAYGAFLDVYRDLLWGMRWLVVPAIFASMVLVIANAISISVRERRTEMAVLKVLGFRPNRVMFLVLGEALIIGLIAGLLSAGGAYLIVQAVDGIPLMIAFFPKFFIGGKAAVWGIGFGILAAVLGSLIPAWSARSVKPAEVFSKVA